MSTTAPLQKTAVKPQQSSFLVHGGRLLQRKCACGSPTASLTGECEDCKNKKGLQAKLTIGANNDPLEQEADRVADQVLAAAPLNSAVSGAPPHIQRYTGQSTGQTDTVPASVDRVLAGSGRPLEPALRQDMEQRFGHDFSRVRVHSGGTAEQSARDVSANAYTVGHNIVFGAGRLASGTTANRRLLAHELCHVIQQAGSTSLDYLRRQPEVSEETLGEEPEQEDEDVEDGDVDVPGLDYAPDFDFEPHGLEPLTTVEHTSPSTTEPEEGEIPLGRMPTGKIKHIDVDQVSQRMEITFSDGQKITHIVSTGRGRCGTIVDPCKSQNAHNCTPDGTFLTVSRGNAGTKNSHGDAMAWFVGLNVPGRNGIGIHDSQTADGTPRSHGCVRVGKSKADEKFAEMINKSVIVGKTDVTISGKAKTKPYPCPKKKKP